RNLGLPERGGHQFEPAISFRRTDGEGNMPHPQPGMAPRLRISRMSAKPLDEKVPQADFRAIHVLFRIQGHENLILTNPFIKRRREALETVFAKAEVNLVFRNHSLAA